MLRHYLAAALRNLARSRLYASISVAGLGIGLAGALLSLLVARSQLTQDSFIPGYRQLYQLVTMTQAPAEAPRFARGSPARLAALLEERFPNARASRLMLENGGLQLGDASNTEAIYWADADFFDLVQLPVVAGSLATALRAPEGLVLDRATARRYFGRDDPVGEMIQLRSAATRELHPMKVLAVIEDLPPEASSFRTGIFASGLAAHSLLNAVDRAPPAAPGENFFGVMATTYLRLPADAQVSTLQQQMPALLRELSPVRDGTSAAMELVRTDRLNQHPGLAPDFAAKLALVLLLGCAILLVAVINFVNLMTARADQRALEVGIRKVSGAGRSALVLQFLGESLVYALLGTVLAVALAEWSLPYVNSFLNTGATFGYWRDPVLFAALLATPPLLALLAGAWPALVLSAFRPGAALASGQRRTRSGGGARQVFVALQFSLLIALLIAAGVVFQQRHFALTQAMRAETSRILMVWAPCREGFLNDLRAIRGVSGFACGSWQWIDRPDQSTVLARDGSRQSIGLVPVDLAVFELYGLKPVAGRFTLEEAGKQYPRDPSRYVINEAAARRLGFSSAQQAVGQHIETPRPGQAATMGGSEIIGVVPDFSLGSIRMAVQPTAYLFEPGQQYLISVRLTGEDVPGTLAAIDRAWAATGAKEATNRFFLDQRLQQMYLPMLRQAQAFGVFALVTVLLAAFGLFGLAAASVARRTREIGIRKALGATTGDVLRLLLWQFSKPVLWANCVAWPIAGLGMQRWLEGFAYRIELPVWLFPAAAFAALVIALLTVAMHSILVARARPIVALRHE